MGNSEKTNEIIKKILSTEFNDTRYWKYTHSVALSGFLLAKPNLFKAANGTEGAMFALWQIQHPRTHLIPCQTFAKGCLDKLRELENVALIECYGKLSFRGGKLKVHMEELVVSNVLTDEPLLTSYADEVNNG